MQFAVSKLHQDAVASQPLKYHAEFGSPHAALKEANPTPTSVRLGLCCIVSCICGNAN